MKLSLPFAVFAAVLATACHSDDKSRSASAISSCPTFNGLYEGKDARGNETGIQLYTRVDAGMYEYSTDGKNFIKADGIPQPIAPEDGGGEMTVSCGSGSLNISGEQGGRTMLTYSITDLGGDQIRMSSDEDSSVVLTKQQNLSNAPTPAQPVHSGDCPVLNGTYAADEGTTSLVLSTTTIDGYSAYQFTANQGGYLVADGIQHPLSASGGSPEGSYIVSCSNDGQGPSVSFRVTFRGSALPTESRYTDLGGGRLLYVSNGASVTLHKR